MVEKAFLNVDNYLNFFKEIDEIYEAKENALDVAFADINAVYGHLLQDEKIKKPNEFLVPEIPKCKKEAKEKRESERESQKSASSSNETFTASSSTTRNKIDDDLDSFRRSSRIASKKIPPALPSSSESKREISVNISTSSIQSVGQSKCHNDTHTKKKNSESTINESSVMCLAHSTPLVLSPAEKENDAVVKTPDEKPSVLKNEENSDSVKKRIEEFEKRVVKNLLPSKLPLRTPDEKKKILEEVSHAENAPTCKNRLLRSNKALKEKNTNIDSSQSQYVKNKKPAGLKNIISSKVKPLVLTSTSNFKATNQRQNENNENEKTSKLEKKNNEKLVPPQKKYFNQDKKGTKLQKSDDSSSILQNGSSTQEIKGTESKLENTNHPGPINTQYEIDHVSENESSEDEEHPKKQIPNWALREIREYPLNVQAWINKKETVYPWFYNKNIKNPKLEELFSVKIKMRPRTSSAVWNTKTYYFK